jgi:hypothetical protein
VVQDGTIWQNGLNWPDSVSASLQTGSSTSANLRMAVLRFDLSFIPHNAEMDIATLAIMQGYKVGTSTVRAHQLLAPWTEATATWANLAGHYDVSVLGSFLSTLPTGSDTGERRVDLTALAQAWVDGAPNHGILLEEDPMIQSGFRSSEHPNVALRPRLEVCYTTLVP